MELDDSRKYEWMRMDLLQKGRKGKVGKEEIVRKENVLGGKEEGNRVRRDG